MSWAFLPLASSKVYERQSPGDSSELPGYLDSSLPPETTIYYLRTLPDFFFQPPSTTRYSTRSLFHEVDEGREVERGMWYVRPRVSIQNGTLFPTPLVDSTVRITSSKAR